MLLKKLLEKALSCIGSIGSLLSTAPIAVLRSIISCISDEPSTSPWGQSLGAGAAHNVPCEAIIQWPSATEATQQPLSVPCPWGSRKLPVQESSASRFLTSCKSWAENTKAD